MKSPDILRNFGLAPGHPHFFNPDYATGSEVCAELCRVFYGRAELYVERCLVFWGCADFCTELCRVF